MLIQNIKNEKKYNATKEEWDRILSTGNAYKYKVLEKDEPIEVRTMKAGIVEEKKKTKK
jgi:hypothetical protein